MSVPLRIECSVPVNPESIRRPVRRSRVSQPVRRLLGVGAISGMLCVLCLAAFGAISLFQSISGAADLKMASADTGRSLSAIVSPAHRLGGYVTVTGSVTNRGSNRAANVEAIVELLDSQNRTVQMDRSMVAFASVPSGESAPFSVIVPDDARAVGYRLSFRHPDGRTIE